MPCSNFRTVYRAKIVESVYGIDAANCSVDRSRNAGWDNFKLLEVLTYAGQF